MHSSVALFSSFPQGASFEPVQYEAKFLLECNRAGLAPVSQMTVAPQATRCQHARLTSRERFYRGLCPAFGSEVQHLKQWFRKKAVQSPLPSPGSSGKRPRTFCANRGLLSGKSGAMGLLCPLPHYLLFIWCFLESWHWSDHRLVWGVAAWAAARETGVDEELPSRQGCQLSLGLTVRCSCVSRRLSVSSVALQQGGSEGPKSFFKVYVTVVSQAVGAASLKEVLGHQNGSSFLSNPDSQGPTPWGGAAAALPHVSDGRAFSSRVLEMLTGSGSRGPTGCCTRVLGSGDTGQDTVVAES